MTDGARNAVGGEPAEGDLAEACGLDVGELRSLLSIPSDAWSLDAALRPDEPTTLLDTIPSTSGGSLDVSASCERRGQATSLLAQLSRRERRILELRFGLDGADDRSFREIGALLGLSTERVRQLERAALDRIRATSPAPGSES